MCLTNSPSKSETPVPTIQYTNIAGEPVTAEVTSLAGEVIEINRSNQTHLHASGGSDYASTHNGRATASVSPVAVSSTTSVHDDVYIITETGEEIFLQLVNWENAGIRKGHHIQVMWLRVTIDNKGSFSTPYVVVNNRSLNKVLYDDFKLQDVVKPSSKGKTAITAFNILSPIAKAGTVILAIVFFFSIFLIPAIAGLYVWLVKNLLSKLPALVNRSVKPQLQALLLPPVNKSTN